MRPLAGPCPSNTTSASESGNRDSLEGGCFVTESSAHDRRPLRGRRNDERAEDGITGVQMAPQFQRRHGFSFSFAKWMFVRARVGVPLSHTARKSPGATSNSVG